MSIMNFESIKLDQVESYQMQPNIMNPFYAPQVRLNPIFSPNLAS